MAGSYLNATRHSSLLNPRSFGAPAKTPSLEGFLFPDTYQLREPVSIGALVADQLRDFKKHFSTVKLAYARSHHLTAYDVLTIASMIERESATAHDRPLIASVIYNRLRLGMRLQIDATTRYAVNNYTSPLTESQLHSPSPWNTYTHTGLPPTPIDSPSLASIQAAAHPATTKYLYFVVKPCGNGEQVFSSSYSQFLKDEQRATPPRAASGAAPVPGALLFQVVTGRTRLGVVGWPVHHSRSPQMHNAALRALGLAGWRYQLLPIPPELFEATVRALPGAGFRGVNVTIPHKEAALSLADRPSGRALKIGAANLLLFEDDGTISADNTDAPALIEALPVPVRDAGALVLGAGGSARAAVWALREAGAEVRIWNRTPDRAHALAREFGVSVAERAEAANFLVNCTPIGLVGGGGELKQLPVRADEIAMFGCVIDFVYSSAETDLIRAARRAGRPTVDGLQLLVGQGALSFERFTGVAAPLEQMRSAAGREMTCEGT